MKAASSCSILQGLSHSISGPFNGSLSSPRVRPPFFCHGTSTPKRQGNLLVFLDSSSSALPFHATHPSKGSVSRPARLITAFSSLSTELEPEELAVLLEVEGVLVDAYRVGNRRAFNKAFQKLGLDCANWTEPIYLDLVRKSGGNEERMLILYFNRIGWPTSLPTSEKNAFVKSVLQEKKNALDELMMSKDIPLRPGVEEFIDNACNEGIPVVILTSYGRSGEKVARAVVEMLGHDRISKIKIVGTSEIEQSLYGQLVLGGRLPSGVDEELVKEVRKAASAEKQRIAEEVASMLKLSVELDTISSESLQNIVAALRAGAEFSEVPLYRCVLVAGSQSGVSGAQQIGMACVVLRSSSRAEFPSAKATVDGFGSPDLTISRLRRIL
ncbi:CBBY-like protein [Punica granatum]|nr:CBBY-like protein [Punica granatum]